MQTDAISAERRRREALWKKLATSGGPNQVSPGLLRQLGLYGGAQGIWVNKEVTGTVSPNGAGVAVSVLHTGQLYDDDLSDDCLIYHFPDTDRTGDRDTSEI